MTLSASAQKELETQIWNFEMSYWEALKSLDIDAYKHFLHPQFSDWPGFLDEPVENPETMADVVQGLMQNTEQIDCKLTQKTISIIHENQAVVYFNCELRIVGKDGEVTQSKHRMIHVWSKHDEEWKLQAGLQAP